MRGARCLSKRAAGTLRWDGTAAAFTSPGRFVAFGGSQHRGQRQGRAAVWRWVAGSKRDGRGVAGTSMRQRLRTAGDHDNDWESRAELIHSSHFYSRLAGPGQTRSPPVARGHQRLSALGGDANARPVPPCAWRVCACHACTSGTDEWGGGGVGDASSCHGCIERRNEFQRRQEFGRRCALTCVSRARFYETEPCAQDGEASVLS
ncbi:unnamed protein product [Lampetra fluviatilis]